LELLDLFSFAFSAFNAMEKKLRMT